MQQFTVNSTELLNRSVLTNDACGSQTFSGQGHHIVGLTTWCYLNPSFRTHRFICSTVLLDTSALLKVEHHPPPPWKPKDASWTASRSPPASDSPFANGSRWRKLAFFCQLWQRCALKPFAANKLALFWVMTCLSLSAWVLADPLPTYPPPNLPSVRNGCDPPLYAVPSIMPSHDRPPWPFACPTTYCLTLAPRQQNGSGPVVWKTLCTLNSVSSTS